MSGVPYSMSLVPLVVALSVAPPAIRAGAPAIAPRVVADAKRPQGDTS